MTSDPPHLKKLSESKMEKLALEGRSPRSPSPRGGAYGHISPDRFHLCCSKTGSYNR